MVLDHVLRFQFGYINHLLNCQQKIEKRLGNAKKMCFPRNFQVSNSSSIESFGTAVNKLYDSAAWLAFDEYNTHQESPSPSSPKWQMFTQKYAFPHFDLKILWKAIYSTRSPRVFLPPSPMPAVEPLATKRLAQRSGCVPWSSAPAGASASASLAPEIFWSRAGEDNTKFTGIYDR